MAVVYVSIGSNVEPTLNINAAIEALKSLYGKLNLSPIYQNSAVGFDGDDFLNLVVEFNTEQSIADLVDSLHEIEAAQGRDRQSSKFSPRTLDMDLLLYDEVCFESPSVTIPRDEITKYAFVLQPLYDLIPHFVHPLEQRTIEALWEEFDKSDLQMKKVTLPA